MNEKIMETDMFSSMEGEMISSIKRPSFPSVSSEESLDNEIPNQAQHWKSSTPFKRELVDDTICEKSDDGIEDYHFAEPSRFPSARSGKRFSLSSFNDASRAYNMNKSSSMHDVSSLSSFCPLRRDSCMFSNETLQSNSIATTKSKDSGFQRSTSCTSLTTNASKKYDHVQSKVRQYIQTIKQTEALRKMQKRLEKNTCANAEINLTQNSPQISPSPDSSPISKRDLLNKVRELEEELKERDCVIEQLEKNQSELRLKYAAAENRIDDLRIRASAHESPLKQYISDEKVAELLTNNAKISSPKYHDNVAAKKSTRNAKSNSASTFAVSSDSYSSVRELQPITKFSSNSIRIVDEYPVLKSEGILKSSSRIHAKDGCHELSKSASNVDRTFVRFADNDTMELPYEKNSFAKVQHWQRSLGNLSNYCEDSSRLACCSPALISGDVHYCGVEDSAEENRRCKTRRYQKNKDADKRRYRKSYPVGCRCDKYKCKSKEDVSTLLRTTAATTAQTKLMRSVSFASCEDSLTSSMYDEDGSSSDSSAVFCPRQHESYKHYKQRKLQQRFVNNKLPASAGDRSPKWRTGVEKTKSVGNVATALHGSGGITHDVECAAVGHRNKRLLDVSTSSHEYSCNERKQCPTPLHNKLKYRKLDDCTKVASAGCNTLVKCRSAHVCRSGRGYDDANHIQHSKSFDGCGRKGHDKESSRRSNKLECSCLTALENLKLEEHNAFVKFAEHIRKHPQKVKEKETFGLHKRYSLQK